MITSVDRHAGIMLVRNPQWDAATDDVRTALPDQVVVRTNLSGLERDQALLAGSPTSTSPAAASRRRRPPGWTRRGTTPVRDRLDDLTTGTMRLLAMPADVAPMDDPACRAASTRWWTGARCSRRSAGRSTPSARRSCGPATCAGAPEETDPRPDLDAARAALEECGQPDGFRR